MAQDSKTLFAVIEAIIDREGGFVNHPADKGGPTKFGITQATLSAWRDQPATEEDVRNLEKPEAREIYLSNYIIPIADTPSDLFPHVADIAVHSGVAKAKQLRDRALLAANPKVELIKLRLKFLGGIIAARPNQIGFWPGWVNRVIDFLE